MKSLYTYFGLLDLHDIDSPGHSLYQIGLVDSLRETYSEEKFDFYSYYPEDIINSADIQGFPKTQLGELFHSYRAELFAKPIHKIDDVLINVRNKEYANLYLKARFRNLSTLSKKWKDARDFENIIDAAIDSGYSKHQIRILDTDLSLSPNFIKKYEDHITILIPSIDFPGISRRFLEDCAEININSNKPALSSVFYGNINTSNYKSGNSKSDILPESLAWISDYHSSENYFGHIENLSSFYVICKESDFNFTKVNTHNIKRNDRVKIWETLEDSRIMVNITKEKYDDHKFIPARIFEAMIFGMIPVSYKFNWLCPAFSFDNLDDLNEIYTYLSECDNAGLIQAYKYFVNSYMSIS